jgi:hypothetical protein
VRGDQKVLRKGSQPFLCPARQKLNECAIAQQLSDTQLEHLGRADYK